MGKKDKGPSAHFNALTVKDLLEARDAYHVHLSNLENVVGTAIGRYRIRKEDPDAAERSRNVHRDRRHAPPRTLANSVVTDWSWPCVLVFVGAWREEEEFRREPDQVVPRNLYLPDGRVVPTCVVTVEPQPQGAVPLGGVNFPSGLLGGGFPVVTRVQNEDHLGTIGCLVTDGDSFYALTNRHVAGTSGREIAAVLHGARARIGLSDPKQAGKKVFAETYRGLSGARAVANLDAGLIQIDDRRQWTAQVYGLGPLAAPIDVSPDNVSLDLIGQRVVAFGAASGRMEGEVQGLFYRYRTVGGLDYVTDVLIGPRTARSPMRTHPGDSGTLWCVEESPGAFRPLAMQWGGHQFAGTTPNDRYAFALGTFLSTICRELDVEVVIDWNTGFSEYWGKLGHFLIAAKACGLVSDAKLRKLLGANLENIGYGDDELVHGAAKKSFADRFVPLADVPDLAWKRHTGRGKEGDNHFADMDRPGQGPFAGKTLLELSTADPANVTPKVWNAFYEALGGDDAQKRGCLPFRVGQIFEAMVAYARAGDAAHFVAAGGVLSHYVGDACQPLHVSRYHHGRTSDEENVHEDYETKMLDHNVPELIAGVNALLEKTKVLATGIETGHDAACATVALMAGTFALLPPEHVCDVFDEASGSDHLDAMWKSLGQDTCEAMAKGAELLARLWQSAWDQGKAMASKLAAAGALGQGTLEAIYRNPKFCPSLSLVDMEAQGLLAAAVDAPPKPQRPKRGRAPIHSHA